MIARVKNCVTDELWESEVCDFGTVPVGFYAFIRKQLLASSDLEFVKFELSFQKSVVCGDLFDEPLVEFK